MSTEVVVGVTVLVVVVGFSNINKFYDVFIFTLFETGRVDSQLIHLHLLFPFINKITCKTCVFKIIEIIP